MIPLQLSLTNFLSYRLASLDFQGLHTACICGANGAGKSSLLEAMTWAIWGQSRAASDDDVIHTGEKEVRVDFVFVSNQQAYKVIRSRRRGQSSSLEFQVKNPKTGQFRSISAKGVKATQEEIIQAIRLDYDTFVNSAYLRQGRADEFMLRRPSERKQILADLLKLDQYEKLATQAKDFSKQLKGQIEQLEQSLEPLQKQLAEREEITQQQNGLTTQLTQLQRFQDNDRKELQKFQALDSQRQTWQQQLGWEQTQHQNLIQDCDRLAKDCASVKNQLFQLQNLLAQEADITAGYQQLSKLQQEEETLAQQFKTYQNTQKQRQQLEQQLTQQENELKLQIRQTQTRLENLQQQEQELQGILEEAEDVKTGMEHLISHRQRLQELDGLQLKVSPLLQRRQSLQTEIHSAQARLTAKLDQLRSTVTELSTQTAQIPHLRKTVLAVDAEVVTLDKKRVYQQRVQDKGNELRTHSERLRSDQRIFEKQIGELQQKLAMLQVPQAICPLCDRELDDHHRHHVIEKTQSQHQQLQQQCWVIQEQMTVCDRELQTLYSEQSQLTQELERYDTLLQQRGQLEAQLENACEIHERLQEIEIETQQIERSLTIGHYALELHTELQNLDQELQHLNYDEKTHALVRGEVERWRWAEIKQSKLKDAQQRLTTLLRQKPELQQQLSELQTQVSQLYQDSALQRQLQEIDSVLEDINYSPTHHNEVMSQIRQAQSWQLQYEKLQQAQQDYPQYQTRLQELETSLQERLADRDRRQQTMNELMSQMKALTDYRQDIQTLEHKIQQQRQQLDELLAQQGRLQQRLTQLDGLQTQYESSAKQLESLRKQVRVYTELAQAFGKNGIQALMIENILPQLEAQTNQILARLTNNQLHVQFLTQKAGRSRSKKNAKLIDTLEILIADAQGTRSYETYSGGEAFRINFAIRLALARLLAQRAGASLQMLIIDEGFGTQDNEGCDRLIAAINAIASDFSCILSVTHMPQFKEAFQTHIEVRKTPQGSKISLTN